MKSIVLILFLALGCTATASTEREETNEHDVSIVVSRTFDTDFERELISKAESIYPNSDEVIDLIHKTIDPKIEKAKKYSDSAEYKDGKLLSLYREWKTEALNEANPWWYTKIEGIKIPYTITDQAIEGLRDYCEGLRESNSQQKNKEFWMRGRMLYSAKITKHKQHYESQKDRTFFIVKMRLRYNREGWGFTFEREVIFDDKGELILWTRDGTITVT